MNDAAVIGGRRRRETLMAATSYRMLCVERIDDDRCVWVAEAFCDTTRFDCICCWVVRLHCGWIRFDVTERGGMYALERRYLGANPAHDDVLTFPSRMSSKEQTNQPKGERDVVVKSPKDLAKGNRQGQAGLFPLSLSSLGSIAIDRPCRKCWFRV